jgi:hypothetical protein
VSKTFTLTEAQTLLPVLESLLRKAQAAVARRGQVGGHLQSPGAFADACDQHFLLVANHRVKLAFRDACARGDLERAGCGIAILHERREGRLEDARANGGLVAGLLTRICLRQRHHHLP